MSPSVTMLPVRNFKFLNEGSLRRTRNYRFCEKNSLACRNAFRQRPWVMGGTGWIPAPQSSSSFSNPLAGNAPIRSLGPAVELPRSQQRIRERERRGRLRSPRSVARAATADQEFRSTDPELAVQNSHLQRRSGDPGTLPHYPCVARWFAVTVRSHQPTELLRRVNCKTLERVKLLGDVQCQKIL
jgi:hypothetical protein